MTEPVSAGAPVPGTPEPTPAPPVTPARRLSWSVLVGLAVGCGFAFLLVMLIGGVNQAADDKKEKDEKPADTPPVARKRIPAPGLDGGVAWLNTGGPLALKDLKGKVVLLDFWTLCCINCIHILPDLHKLEKKYANELVVVGVHSPKFDNEKDSKSIRKAVLRYEIQHPVVNDAERKIWDRFEVDAWPTFVLIDPEGNLVGYTSGEGNYDLLDMVVGKVVEDAKKRKTLDQKPIRFDLARYREKGDTPLFFPGKVVADAAGKRLFIADSTHHRVVVTDLDGNRIAVAGTGQPGKVDGSFEKAQFDDPQGMAVTGDTLYVADRKNHVIRALDLKARTVTTAAGNGQQEGDPGNRRMDKPVPATTIGLNSPWDLLWEGGKLYVAMAGHHQIWAFDPAAKEIGPYAGSGRETIGDGPLRTAMFAQPSGLASDGKFLYVADSEISALRKVPLGGKGEVETLVGRGLFVFGDRDGPGRVEDVIARETKEARLQHALGITYADGKLYVADTYNSKIRVYDPKTGTLGTFLGGDESDGWLSGPLFSEPAGISSADGKLYVADTNAHRIRVVDLKSKQVTTLKLKGVEPPPVPKDDPKPKELGTK
ncbi:MAG: ykuV [Gemmataceae bacterium]|nr:ykuV [Gemmataceae bacterium]